jgi:hypothetical protein
LRLGLSRRPSAAGAAGVVRSGSAIGSSGSRSVKSSSSCCSSSSRTTTVLDLSLFASNTSGRGQAARRVGAVAKPVSRKGGATGSLSSGGGARTAGSPHDRAAATLRFGSPPA